MILLNYLFFVENLSSKSQSSMSTISETTTGMKRSEDLYKIMKLMLNCNCKQFHCSKRTGLMKFSNHDVRQYSSVNKFYLIFLFILCLNCFCYFLWSLITVHMLLYGVFKIHANRATREKSILEIRSFSLVTFYSLFRQALHISRFSISMGVRMGLGSPLTSQPTKGKIDKIIVQNGLDV